MTAGSIVTATMFAVLAAAHSAAGETGFIKPLLNAEWSIAEVPRPAANRLLRGAWHLTSIAWLSMAVIAIGGSALTAIAVAGLASGLIMFLFLRGHPAWPLFLIAGAAGLYADGVLGSMALHTAAALGAAALAAASLLHLYWAAGGKRFVDNAVPTVEEGSTSFSPTPLMTAAVAVLLAGFAALVTAVAFDASAIDANQQIARWLVTAGIAILAARAVGDGRYAGFSKKHRQSTFAELDDAVYTPLVTFIAMGAGAALIA